MSKSTHAVMRASLEDELNGAHLYEALATAEHDKRLAEVFRRMARSERKHAAVWRQRLKRAGASIPNFRPGWRSLRAGTAPAAATPCARQSWVQTMVSSPT